MARDGFVAMVRLEEFELCPKTHAVAGSASMSFSGVAIRCREIEEIAPGNKITPKNTAVHLQINFNPVFSNLGEVPEGCHGTARIQSRYLGPDRTEEVFAEFQLELPMSEYPLLMNFRGCELWFEPIFFKKSRQDTKKVVVETPDGLLSYVVVEYFLVRAVDGNA